MICMILSGWQIYNAAPFFAFRFEVSLGGIELPITLGGWLGGAIAWHLAAMWLLLASGTLYLGWGLLTGALIRRLLPVDPRAALVEVGRALRLRLAHEGAAYNHAQRAAYLFAIAASMLAVVSGFAIWKPVQLGWLTALLGDYEGARRVHFFAMTGIALFLAAHLIMVAAVPRTLRDMLTGGRA